MRGRTSSVLRKRNSTKTLRLRVRGQGGTQDMRRGATGLLALASPQDSMPGHEEACPQRAANEGTRGEGCALLTSTAKINSERKLLCPAGNFSSAVLTPQEAHFLLTTGTPNPRPAKENYKTTSGPLASAWDKKIEEGLVGSLTETIS